MRRISTARRWAQRGVRVALGLCLTAGAVSLAGGAAETAEAAHDYTTLAVRSANAYRHVLEDGDRLVLVQYAMAEDLSDEEESPYGVSGATLRIETTEDVLKQGTPPVAGYALAAFYWDAEGAPELGWEDASAEACIEGNPTLFLDPPSHCMGLVWNTTETAGGTHEETVSELEVDLKVIMASIEQDDPDVEAGQYVSSGGITMEGTALVQMAFPQLLVIAPDAFVLSVQPAGTPFNPPTPGPLASGLQKEGEESAFGQDVKGFGEAFGVPFRASGLIVLMGMLAFTGFLVYRFKGRAEVLLVYVGPMMIWSSLSGGIPFIATVAIIALTAVLGLAGAARNIPT